MKRQNQGSPPSSKRLMVGNPSTNVHLGTNPSNLPAGSTSQASSGYIVPPGGHDFGQSQVRPGDRSSTHASYASPQRHVQQAFHDRSAASHHVTPQDQLQQSFVDTYPASQNLVPNQFQQSSWDLSPTPHVLSQAEFDYQYVAPETYALAGLGQSQYKYTQAPTHTSTTGSLADQSNHLSVAPAAAQRSTLAAHHNGNLQQHLEKSRRAAQAASARQAMHSVQTGGGARSTPPEYRTSLSPPRNGSAASQQPKYPPCLPVSLWHNKIDKIKREPQEQAMPDFGSLGAAFGSPGSTPQAPAMVSSRSNSESRTRGVSHTSDPRLQMRQTVPRHPPAPVTALSSGNIACSWRQPMRLVLKEIPKQATTEKSNESTERNTKEKSEENCYENLKNSMEDISKILKKSKEDLDELVKKFKKASDASLKRFLVSVAMNCGTQKPNEICMPLFCKNLMKAPMGQQLQHIYGDKVDFGVFRLEQASEADYHAQVDLIRVISYEHLPFIMNVALKMPGAHRDDLLTFIRVIKAGKFKLLDIQGVEKEVKLRELPALQSLGGVNQHHCVLDGHRLAKLAFYWRTIDDDKVGRRGLTEEQPRCQSCGKFFSHRQVWVCLQAPCRVVYCSDCKDKQIYNFVRAQAMRVGRHPQDKAPGRRQM